LALLQLEEARRQIAPFGEARERRTDEDVLGAVS
jgi:hypothetical protein